MKWWQSYRPLIRTGTPTAVYAPGMTPEVERLRAMLDGLRAGVLKKLAGLGDEDARRSTVDSGTNLAGLVQHLTFVDRRGLKRSLPAASSSIRALSASHPGRHVRGYSGSTPMASEETSA